MSVADLPDPQLVIDEIFEAGMDAVKGDPALATVRAKLSERDIRCLVAVITNATGLIAVRQVVRALCR